ncbi:MAG: NIPSNAP family protein [Planctomycetaceae bacterium]|nr:NIPSNAP family protein [Planctomycetaceae bacterium]
MSLFDRILCLLLVSVAVSPVMAADEVPVYELRVYTCEAGKLDALHARFREHTMRIFEKHGMTNVGYWTPTDGPEATTTLVYLLRHASADAAAKSWDAFRNDPEWKQVAQQSKEQHGKILAKAPESQYLTLTEFSPAVGTLPVDAVFELRTYTTEENRLAALHKRFHDHTIELFKRHGMTNLWYFTPQDEARREQTLVYFLAHTNREAAQASWKAFLADPEWQAAAKASEQDGKILAKRPDAMFLKLTDYSPSAGK